MPKIYFIIVTYNAMKWAEKCFSSLRKSSVSVQTIVVDNGSADGTQDFIRCNFPEVELIQSPKNLGFGKANNIGIGKAYKAGADFFYLMNQDAWIYEDSVEKLLLVYEGFEEKEKIGILSPMHLAGSEKHLDIFLDKYIATNYQQTRLTSDLYLRDLKTYYEMTFVNAAHWFLPKDTVEKVGGFNPYFYHYGEDVEYANRVKFHQKKILLVPSSRAVHDGKQDLQKVDYSKYDDLSIETKIMDPSGVDILKSEKRALLQSIAKCIFTGNIRDISILEKKYSKISKEGKKLTEMAAKLRKTEAHFLFLK